MRTAFRAGILAAAAALAACVAPGVDQTHRSGEPITPDMLLDASPLADGAELPDLSNTDILGLTPEMIAFVEGYIEPHYSPQARLRRLLFAVMEDDNFDLVYDDLTRTASETFQDQHGNCLSFTNMFVAMARHLGLDARYQEVDIPADWSLEGQTLLLSQHVNVFVDFKHATSRIVDFNITYDYEIGYDLDIVYDRRVISDSRARAHYFNNIGVEHMLLGGDTLMALANFRESLRQDETFSPTWINLGLLHRRDGHFDYAELAYQQALKYDGENLVAMSNLANLYEKQGKTGLAQSYREKVRTHRMNNPYYRYQQAQIAVVEGDYAAAKDHLNAAMRKRKDDDRFYFLMSVAYLMSGDKQEAQTWLKKAEEIAGDNNSERYGNKIERLMQTQVEH